MPSAGNGCHESKNSLNCSQTNCDKINTHWYLDFTSKYCSTLFSVKLFKYYWNDDTATEFHE